MKKRIGVLTSGGDCAGLNATLRAVVRRAFNHYGWDVIGIKQGTEGLFKTPLDVEPLTPEMFDGTILRQGGTILGTTSKGNPFSYTLPNGKVIDRSPKFGAALKQLNLDAIIGIGGDGSQAILLKLAHLHHFNLITIPKTIDNDVGVTEVSVGFHTAMTVATNALDMLEPTAASHKRIMILEVMGRDAGHIALWAGIAGGADIILIPEIPYTIKTLVNHIQKERHNGRDFSLIIVAESVQLPGGHKVKSKGRYGGVGHALGDLLTKQTGRDVRVTVLGHLPRGAAPTPQDRLLASAFGVHAVDLIAQGKQNRMVAWVDRDVRDFPIEEAIKTYRGVNLGGVIVKTARGLGICLGDTLEV